MIKGTCISVKNVANVEKKEVMLEYRYSKMLGVFLNEELSDDEFEEELEHFYSKENCIGMLVDMKRTLKKQIDCIDKVIENDHVEYLDLGKHEMKGLGCANPNH